MTRFISNWGPVVLSGIVIFYLSSQSVSSPVKVKYTDLLAHLLVYAIFAILLARAVALRYRKSRFSLSIIIVVIAIIYGALNEWYQAYIPTREASFADGIANAIGALIGVGLYLWILSLR